MSLLNHTLAALMPWVPPPLLKRFASRYVAGETLEDMLATVRSLNAQGMLATVDVLGEFITRPEEAREAAEEYKAILHALAREGLKANISVKLSQMGLLLDEALCLSILRELVALAQETNNFVRIDMEDSACTTATLRIYQTLRQEFSNVGVVLQAYLRRTLADARRLMADGHGHFRLCKGIYVEPRRIAYRDKGLINRNFAWLLEEMFKGGAYVGIATHDETLVWEALRLIDAYGLPPEAYEFQMLLGVDAGLRQIILDGGHRLRVYVPFGKHWRAYCLRRLKENPAIVRHLMGNLFKPGT